MRVSRISRDFVCRFAPMAVVITLAACGAETPSSPEVQGWELVGGSKGRAAVNPMEYLGAVGCRIHASASDTNVIGIGSPVGPPTLFTCPGVTRDSIAAAGERFLAAAVAANGNASMMGSYFTYVYTRYCAATGGYMGANGYWVLGAGDSFSNCELRLTGGYWTDPNPEIPGGAYFDDLLLGGAGSGSGGIAVLPPMLPSEPEHCPDGNPLCRQPLRAKDVVAITTAIDIERLRVGLPDSIATMCARLFERLDSTWSAPNHLEIFARGDSLIPDMPGEQPHSAQYNRDTRRYHIDTDFLNTNSLPENLLALLLHEVAHAAGYPHPAGYNIFGRYSDWPFNVTTSRIATLNDPIGPAPNSCVK